MKPTLQLKLGQHLTMTPQLQQAIRLLQLSTLELQTEIQQVLEENPLLELAEEGEAQEAASANTPERAQEDQANGETTPSADEHISIDLDSKQDIPDELAVDSNWDDIYESGTTGLSSPSRTDEGGDNFLENQSGGDESLSDHLLWQLRNTPISENDFLIAVTIIDAINEDGYLTETVEDIHQSLVSDIDIDIEEVEAVLRRVQHFDPIGVAARDLRECLLIQMDAFAADTPALEDARMLVSEHLDLLGSHDYARLQRKTRLTEDQLNSILAFIQTLNPKPGSAISNTKPEYIVPDIYVSKHKNRWVVELNPEAAPKIRINQFYADHVKNRDRCKEAAYLKNSLQEARWFLKSLRSRSETLIRVGKAIVDRQRLFLEYGDEGMKPMVLRDIAEELEMHESTISRVTTHKYMHTPRGVFEFKFFFSSHVRTVDGGECSATAIRAMVKKLIDNENPRKPMSDNKISSFLVKEGINVARRTVAKYRESMSIPPSNERKRLA